MELFDTPNDSIYNANEEEIYVSFKPLMILGYLKTTVPKNIFNYLNNYANTLIKNNFVGGETYTTNLYGAIEHEYIVPRNETLEDFILLMCQEYWKFNYNENYKKTHRLTSLWVNFQKKGEHNPIHNHDGKLSFVIWLKIPYNLDDERNVSNVKNSNNFTSETTSFNFLYSNPLVQHLNDLRWSGVAHHSIQVSKEHEGAMILFDATLPHLVYPFYTSDDYRISVSGNIEYE
jgi:hypothetical protein